jgi:glucose/arabinose dehydrogenase
MRWLLVIVCFAATLAACNALEMTPVPTVQSSPTAESSPIPTEIPSLTTAVSTSTMLTPATDTAVPTRISTPVPSTSPTATGNSELPAPQTVVWQAAASGLNAPVGLVNAGDGSGRLFILEQAGVIRILRGGEILPGVFLDISDQVSCCGERGLLGLAFHPRYTENGYFYLNYTDQDGNTIISRFQVAPDDPDRADPGSEKRLLHVQQPYGNHNGGAAVFGPDGYLYLGLGDGGSAGDPQGNGQSKNTLLGKILRIDVNQGDPYSIPPDNPFVSGGGLGEIWAYGLRNPWRISFDSLTGDLYIADVGQNAWEEIDFLPAGSPPGANFGWSYREGTHPYQGSPPADVGLIDPVEEYSHDQGRCSVTGGVVYRGSELPDWQGVYLYGDYCSGRVWGILLSPQGVWLNAPFFDTGSTITSFGADESGEVYLVDYSGTVYRLNKP